MIKKGVIQEKSINGVKVLIDLIPKTNKLARPSNHMIPISITIHETGNTRKGANAKSHTNYVDNVKSYVSWHFSVDDKEIYQELPINENAWHAGDGKDGKGNRSSIAIEICVNQDGDFEKAKENAKKLIQYLMYETGIKEIFPHRHWNGKYCPRIILNSGWNDFLNYLIEGFGKDNELETIKNERDYWKNKFIDLKEFVDETINFGGH